MARGRNVPEYTITSVLACVLVLASRALYFRHGLFRLKAFWLGEVIVIFFQCLMDGWLTKLRDPIVIYDDAFNLGVEISVGYPGRRLLFWLRALSLALLVWVRREDEQA